MKRAVGYWGVGLISSSTNATEYMNAVVKHHTKWNIFWPDVLIIKFHQLSERCFKEIARGRYDEGDFILARNQREQFRETDGKLYYPTLEPSKKFLKTLVKQVKVIGYIVSLM